MTESSGSPLEQLRRSLDAVDSLIRGVRPDQWSMPTPCDEWDVHRVVEHLVGLNRVFAAMLEGGAPPRGGALAAEDLASQFRESSTTLLHAFGQSGVLERSYTSPMGSATGQERLMIRLYDLLAHGWDIARATGQDPELPVDAAEAALRFARDQVVDDARPGRFEPPQPVAEDAPAIERLVGFLGRPVS
jgi:uncharacterized protein (TIGR03086 family)